MGLLSVASVCWGAYIGANNSGENTATTGGRLQRAHDKPRVC